MTCLLEIKPDGTAIHTLPLSHIIFKQTLQRPCHHIGTHAQHRHLCRRKCLINKSFNLTCQINLRNILIIHIECGTNSKLKYGHWNYDIVDTSAKNLEIWLLKRLYWMLVVLEVFQTIMIVLMSIRPKLPPTIDLESRF